MPKIKGKQAICEQCHELRIMDKNRKICHACRRLNQNLNNGTVRPPDFAEVNVENYKEPMEKVEGGFGYYGAITTTNDGEHIQCHICGYFFANISTHVSKKHKMSSRDYKMKYGLRINDGLLSPLEKERKQLSYNRTARKTPEEYREMSRKAHAAIKAKGVKLGGDGWGPQTRNEKGMCKEQTIAKIQELAEVNGGVASLNAFIREYGTGQRSVIEHWFGTWNKAVEAAGLVGHTERLQQHRLELEADLLQKMRDFYHTHGRTPQWSDFQAGAVGYNVRTAQTHYGSLNAARQEAGIPILVYSSSERHWVEIEPDQQPRAGDLVPSVGGRLAPAI